MKLLLVLLGGFEVSDGIITHLLVGNDLIREGNPLMEPIIREGNFLSLKVIGALLCLLILWGTYRLIPRVTQIATSSIVIFYGVVLAWNLSVFFRVLPLSH